MANAELVAEREAVRVRFRFKDIINLLTPPTDEEIDAALEDSIAYINGFDPVTYFTIEEIKEVDFWKPIWYQAAGMFVLATILRDWTANGYDAVFQELNIPNRKGDYEALLSSEQQNIDGWLERVKPTSQRTSRMTSRIRDPLPRRTFIYPGYGGKRTKLYR